jgi:hypothetical protein
MSISRVVIGSSIPGRRFAPASHDTCPPNPLPDPSSLSRPSLFHCPAIQTGRHPTKTIPLLPFPTFLKGDRSLLVHSPRQTKQFLALMSSIESGFLHCSSGTHRNSRGVACLQGREPIKGFTCLINTDRNGFMHFLAFPNRSPLPIPEFPSKGSSFSW